MADTDRIKRNIQKMIDQGAPDEDIDAYLADEGTTPEQLRAGPGLFQREGGLADYLPAPVMNAMQRFSDTTTSSMDVATHGFGDKIFGTQDETAAARQRIEQAGGNTVPGDIATAVATAPYRVASTGAAAVAGGLEGIATEYGNQPNWVPSWSEAGDILLSGGKGAALGSGAAKLGEGIGSVYSKWMSKRSQPYRTDKALNEAVAERELVDPFSLGTRELRGHADRTAAARAANTRSDFSKLQPGNAAEASKLAEIAGGPKSLTSKVGSAAEKVRGRVTTPALVAEAVSSGGIPWTSLAGMAVKSGLSSAGKSQWANRVPRREIESLAALTRDPRGIGIQSDPVTIDMLRDRFAKMAIGYGRTP